MQKRSVCVFDLHQKQRAEKRGVDSSTEERSPFKQRRLELREEEEVHTDAQVNSALTCSGILRGV